VTRNGVNEGPPRESGMKRLRKLRASIAERGLDALLVSQPENRRYLSGFTGSAGWLFISERKAVLATDFRYVEQAKAESPGFEIVRTERELRDWLPGLVSDSGWRKLGFEAAVVSYDSHQKLSEAIEAKKISLELVPAIGLMDHLRSIKEPEELDSITRAVALADTAFEQAKRLLRPGITEEEVAWEIEKLLHQGGSEGVAFEITVASGSNSALPHARPTEKRIRSGEPILIDMGARVKGYCSDLSRTVFLGEADKTLRQVYDIVSEAQAAATERVQSGMSGSQADELARSVIDQSGYKENFGHGLGHGVGLAVHEFPRLGPASCDWLADGMVFTVEPGIYLPGQGGVRIEDLVVLTNGTARVLSSASRDLLV